MIIDKFRISVAVVAGALALTGCTTTGPKQTSGALIGGTTGMVAGAIIGNAIGGRDGTIVGAAVGGLAGGLIGSEIGRELDERDRAMREAAVRRAYAANASHRQTWYNPVTGNRGEIQRLNTHPENGTRCATFVESVYKKGAAQPIREENKRCANADGSF